MVWNSHLFRDIMKILDGYYKMPIKRIKNETKDKLNLKWILQLKNFNLTLNKGNCVKCQICSLACPKDAIKIKKNLKDDIKKELEVEIDFELDKCNFCGICDVICPFGAIDVYIKGHDSLPAI